MKLKIDRSAHRFIEIGQQKVRGERRRYYVTRANDKVLAILVCRSRASLPELIGEIVDAQIGYEDGVRGFVLEQNIGRRHTKITIYRKLHLSRYDMVLSRVLKC